MRGWYRRWAGWTRPTITPSLSLCRHPEDGASPSEPLAYPADGQDCFSAEYIEGFSTTPREPLNSRRVKFC
jgi:hypothetical protein